MAFDPLKLMFGRDAQEETARASLSGGRPGERRESVQRLQVGFFGLGAMILLVGLANIIMNSVKESQASAVPEAAPTVVASETPPAVRDPLADAGVVPDLPAEPETAVTPIPRPAGSGAATPRPAGNGAASPQP